MSVGYSVRGGEPRGIISGIKRMEIHDGDGLRTTVFFKGCPLRCIWCHNPESLSPKKQVAFFREKCISCGACGGVRSEETAAGCPVDAIRVYGREYGREYALGELLSEVLRDEPFFRMGGGVTLSGGECLAQPELATALARELCERGISVYVDTCGYVPRRVLEDIIPYTDKFLYDVKAVNGEVHKSCTGRDNALILDNLRFLCERGCDVEIRYPLVVGFNDRECEGIATLLEGLGGISRVKVLRFHALSASRYDALGMEDTLPDTETTPEDITHAVEILRRHGLAAVDGTLEA